MSQTPKNFILKPEKFFKIEQKSVKVKQPSIQFADSPCSSYFAGSQSNTNQSQFRQSTCSSADTIDTPTSSFNALTSKNSQTNSIKKHHKSIIPQNFTQFVEAIKSAESNNQQEKIDLNKTIQLTKNNSSNQLLIKNKKENQNQGSLEDDDEHSAWDNTPLESQGVDCKTFLNKNGNPFTFYQLYRLRQCQMLGEISEKTTINEVYIISEHYRKPVKKSELVKQQQYLSDNYSKTNQQINSLKTQKQRSAQLINQQDQQNIYRINRQQSQQSSDKIKSALSPSKSISDLSSCKNSQVKNNYNSPRNIFQNKQQYFFSNQQNLPMITLKTKASFFKQQYNAATQNSINSSEQNIFTEYSSQSYTERSLGKKLFKFSNQNETSLEECTPKQKQPTDTNQQKLMTFNLQQKIKNFEILQNQGLNSSKKQSQKIQIKTQQFQTDSPYHSQSSSTYTQNFPKYYNKTQQRIKQYLQTNSYCNLKKFNI